MEDREKWIEDVFDSMKGSQRAKPRADLFAKIEQEIQHPETRVIPLYQRRIAVAAAIVLLAGNVFALRHYVNTSQTKGNEIVMDETLSPGLISNYNLYE